MGLAGREQLRVNAAAGSLASQVLSQAGRRCGPGQRSVPGNWPRLRVPETSCACAEPPPPSRRLRSQRALDVTAPSPTPRASRGPVPPEPQLGAPGKGCPSGTCRPSAPLRMLLPHLEGSQSPRDQDRDRVGLAPASVDRIREIRDEAGRGLSSRPPPPPHPQLHLRRNWVAVLPALLQFGFC